MKAGNLWAIAQLAGSSIGQINLLLVSHLICSSSREFCRCLLFPCRSAVPILFSEAMIIGACPSEIFTALICLDRKGDLLSLISFRDFLKPLSSIPDLNELPHMMKCFTSHQNILCPISLLTSVSYVASTPRWNILISGF